MSSSTGIIIVDVPCTFCGSVDLQTLLENLEDIEDRVPGRYTISRCAKCGLVYLSRRPTMESLPQCYVNYHVVDPVRRNLIPEFLYGLRLESRCRRLLDCIGNNCHAVLEIGCGDGSFLRRLSEKLPAECILTGIDFLVPPTDKTAPSRLTLIQGEFEKINFSVKYDAAVMFNVLEHLADPADSLKRISQQLNSGGVLLGEVPNWDSCWRKVFPRHWQGLQVPRHQTHFDKVSLRKMLDAAGYDIVGITDIFDPGDLAVTLCNWIADKLKLRTPSRRVWFYFPTVLLSAPVVWIVNKVTRNSGSIGFTARKR